MRQNQRVSGAVRGTVAIVRRSIFTRVICGLTLLAMAAALVSAPRPSFTPRQKAYYASADTVAFVRPGLVFKIGSVTIAGDGTVTARFKISDPRGLPLDRDGITTPGSVSSSFVLSRI